MGRDVNAITGPVTMAYELNMSKITPERLFNLLCLYGDVMRVKFLTTKEGCAMIEMSSPGSVAKVIQNLSGVELFGKEVVFRTCRQMEVVGGGRDVSRDIKTMANGSR